MEPVVVGEPVKPVGRGTMELRRRRCLSNISFLGLCGLDTCNNGAGEDAPEGGLAVREGGLAVRETAALFFFSPPPPPPDLCL